MPRLSSKSSAFTLIELLTVIAIIGVLAGITFGVVRGVGEQAKINRATTELSALSTGLEEYKRFYGDYPWVGNDTYPNQLNPKDIDPTDNSSNDRAYQLFRALGGRLAPKRLDSNNKGIVQRQIDRDGTRVDKYNRAFIDFALFQLERSKDTDRPNGIAPLPVPAAAVNTPDPDFANALLDPWGNRYLYYYKSTASPNTWNRSGYVLMSAGPDGKATFPSTLTAQGTLPASTDVDADNIYARL